MKRAILSSIFTMSILMLFFSCKREYCDDFTNEQISYFPYHEGQVLKFYNSTHDSIFYVTIAKVQIDKIPEPMLAPGIGCTNRLEISDDYRNFNVVAKYSNREGFIFNYYYYGLRIFSSSNYEHVDSLAFNDKKYYDLLKSETLSEGNLKAIKNCYIKPYHGLLLFELFDSSYYEIQ